MLPFLLSLTDSPFLLLFLFVSDTAISTDDQALALRVFNSLMSNQETKSDAIAMEAGASLVRHSASPSLEVAQLSCRGMEHMALLMVGRFHLVAAGAVEALTANLGRCPVEAAEALCALAGGPEGCERILSSGSRVVFALVDLIKDRAKPEAAIVAALAALTRVAGTDAGIMECLEALLPAAVLNRVKIATEPPFQGGLGSKIRTAAAECLSQLCHHPYGKVQVLENLPGVRNISGVEALARLLKAPEWLARKFATRALMGLTVEVAAKLPVARQTTSALVGILRGADLELAENARMVLLNCKEQPDAAGTIFSIMSREEWHDTLGKWYGPVDQYGNFVADSATHDLPMAAPKPNQIY